MASVDAQWMPVTGRHEVSIGKSLGRALRARKGIPKRASNLPDRELYSFRYNFKPESIDPDKPGSIEVKRTKESTSVSMERPGLQPRESHLFKGTEQPVKEYDCVLVYDEEMGTFTLEKIDTFMTFTHDRKVQSSSSSAVQRETASPMAITPQPADDDADLMNQLEKDLVGLEDAEGEPDDDFEEVIAPVISAQNNLRFEEEEEEEEEELLLAASKAPPPPTLPAKPKPSHNVPLNQQEPIPKSKSKSKEVSKPKIELEPEDIVDSELEEVLTFGVPTRTAKRRRLSPVVVQKPPPATQLALPSSSTSVVLPSSRLPPPKEDSDSEEDGWDAVVGDDLPENDTQEIDLEEFEQEMEQQLEELDEDILAAAMPSETSRRPISLNQFAGGQLSQEEEDSTSSSDDSDED